MIILLARFWRRAVTRRRRNGHVDLGVRRCRLLQDVLRNVPQANQGVLTDGAEPVAGDVRRDVATF